MLRVRRAVWDVQCPWGHLWVVHMLRRSLAAGAAAADKAHCQTINAYTKDTIETWALLQPNARKPSLAVLGTPTVWICGAPKEKERKTIKQSKQKHGRWFQWLSRWRPDGVFVLWPWPLPPKGGSRPLPPTWL